MKRGAIIVFFAVVLVSRVCAQDVSIGKVNVSAITLLPLGVIVCCLFLFVIVYLRKNKTLLKKILTTILLYLFGLKKLHINLKHFFQKLKRDNLKSKIRQFRDEILATKKVEKKEKTPITDYIKELGHLKKNNTQLSESEFFHKFAELAKTVFIDVSGLNSSYTDTEIIQHLKNHRSRFAAFAQKLTDIKYRKDIPPQTVQNMLIKEFSRLLLQAASVPQKEAEIKPHNLLERVIKEDVELVENIRHYLTELKREDKAYRVKHLLSKEEKSLKSHIDASKKSYDKILKIYERLSPDDKEKIYPEIKDFTKVVSNSAFFSHYNQKSQNHLYNFTKKVKAMRTVPKKEKLTLSLIGEKIKKAIPAIEIEKSKNSRSKEILRHIKHQKEKVWNILNKVKKSLTEKLPKKKPEINPPKKQTVQTTSKFKAAKEKTHIGIKHQKEKVWNLLNNLEKSLAKKLLKKKPEIRPPEKQTTQIMPKSKATKEETSIHIKHQKEKVWDVIDKVKKTLSEKLPKKKPEINPLKQTTQLMPAPKTTKKETDWLDKLRKKIEKSLEKKEPQE